MRIYYWIIFLVYLGGMLYLGFVGMRRSKTADDYFVAGRSFGLFVSSLLYSNLHHRRDHGRVRWQRLQ